MRKGQGAFEYILMLSGVLLTVVLLIYVFQSTVFSANSSMAGKQDTLGKATNVSMVRMLPGRIANLTVYERTGNINSSAIPCCTWQADKWGDVGLNGPTSCGPAITTNCTYRDLPIVKRLSCPSGWFDVKFGRCT
jgi:hypothetical protein